MSEEGPDHKGFIDLLFGVESTLSKEDFDKSACTLNCKWIFTASSIREKMILFMDKTFLEKFEEQYEPEELKF
jgi:ribulose kinase